MGTPSFGLPGTSNNAPPPVPGNTNPTGTNNGVGFGGKSYPNYPVFGAPSTSAPVTPSSNAPLFGGTNMAGLNSGFDLGSNWSNLANELGKAYGKGPGQAIYNILSQGLFNPQEAAAFLNAMQPAAAQGLASVQNSFGAEGSRFGSAAALGIGNYESQVNLNEQQTLASMYMQSQQEQLQLLEGVLPTLHQEKANKGGWIDDLIGGLEIAGGIAGAAFTGGASLALVGVGAGELNKGIDKGTGGGGSNAAPALPSFAVPSASTPTSSSGYGNPNSSTMGWNNPASPYYLDPTLLDASAATGLGGTDQYNQYDDSATFLH